MKNQNPNYHDPLYLTATYSPDSPASSRKEPRTGWGVGTIGCCQIERVVIIWILIFHISKKIANFGQKSQKKKKNESAISKQTDAQRKMNARGSYET